MLQPRSRFRARAGLVLVVVAWLGLGVTTPAGAESYVPISGAGSSWSFNALDQWRRDVNQYGMRVNYSGTGSSDGRSQFLKSTVDFAASDIPFQYTPEDGSAPEDPGARGLSFAYMPVTAGGTAFMYNLNINGKRVTNLRLSGANVTKIFTGVISKWNDPALLADNPGLAMPDKKIVAVVRSDGSGSSAQFTAWMINQHPGLWNDFCRKSGKPACGQTSYYPKVPGGIAQAQDIGVAGYVSQSYAEGSIGYVNYSYALNTGFPVVKLLNAAGYYTEPTPSNVAVSLLKADINRDEASRDYLNQKLEGVYSSADKRTYSLSSYSYMILPTKEQGQFTATKGKTLAAYSYYAMCQGQQKSASLGYSPMPINLVNASFDQIRKVPGAAVQDITIQSCNNPTFTADGSNKLANEAPQPLECDKEGSSQCATGTGGASKTPTPVKPEAAGGAGPGGGGGPGSTPGGGGAGPGSAPSGPGGAVGTAPGDSAVGGVAEGPLVCDPDTGDCTGGGGGGAGGGGGGGASGEAAAAPLTLAAGSGWGGTQTLMVLAALLTLALVLAPGMVSVMLARRKPT